MGKLTITTDHKWKNLLFGYELTEKERKDFDYMSQDEIETASFVRYRKCVYALSEFQRIEKTIMCGELLDWDGYASDSFFSGVVIKLSDCGEQYIIGTYIS